MVEKVKKVTNVKLIVEEMVKGGQSIDEILIEWLLVDQMLKYLL